MAPSLVPLTGKMVPSGTRVPEGTRGRGDEGTRGRGDEAENRRRDSAFNYNLLGFSTNGINFLT
jgi:hypothetical protein